MQDRFEGFFNIRDHNYHIAIETKGSNTFGIELVDDDTMNRWASDFTSSYIKNITKQVRSEKRISVFWKMLQTAISGNSNEVSLDILTPSDVINMKKRSKSVQLTDDETPRDDKRYLIITQTNEFEQIKYPLLLQYTPLTPQEFGDIIKQLKKENAILRQQNGKQRIAELEAQLIDLNQAYIEMRDEKDAEIAELKEKLIKSIKVPAKEVKRVSNGQRGQPGRSSFSSERAPSVTSANSRNSKSSQRSRGSVRSTSSRGKSPARSSSVRQTSPRMPQRTVRSIEEESDEKLRKLKRYVAQKYRQ